MEGCRDMRNTGDNGINGFLILRKKQLCRGEITLYYIESYTHPQSIAGWDTEVFYFFHAVYEFPKFFVLDYTDKQQRHSIP